MLVLNSAIYGYFFELLLADGPKKRDAIGGVDFIGMTHGPIRWKYLDPPRRVASPASSPRVASVRLGRLVGRFPVLALLPPFSFVL